MGCDIHLYVEKRVNGKWLCANKFEKQEEGNGHTWLNDVNPFYDGRNYSLFAILADVRNGYGFAGCDTGDGFKPIAQPKGLPDDVSKEVQAISDQWECDGHSHSYHTLADLLAYDWTQTTNQRGWVNLNEYIRWRDYERQDGESPRNYSEGVGGSRVRHVTEPEMEKIAQNVLTKFNNKKWDAINWIEEQDWQAEVNRVYAQVEWNTPYYKTCRGFWSDCIPRLLKLGKPEDVRIVFFFDN